MKKAKTFKVGDKVFGKVKGYPAWPAQIVSVNGRKFDVTFYGTGESGCLKPEDIFYYLENKSQFLKPLKRKDYNDAVEEIEKDIAKTGTDGNVESNSDEPDGKTEVSAKTETRRISNGGKRKRSSISSASDQPSKISRRSVEEANIDDTEKAKSEDVRKTTESSEGVIDEDDEEAKEGLKKLNRNDTGKNESKKKENRKKEHEELNGSATELKDSNDEAEENPQSSPHELENVLLIPDIYLTALTIYAQRVREKEDYFLKNKPDVGTLDSEDDVEKVKVLPVKLKSGEYVGIKFIPHDIKNFTSEYERSLDEEKLAKDTLDLKNKILTENETIEDDTLIHNLKSCSENDIYQHLQRTVVNYKNAKLKILKVEHSLHERILEITRALGLDEAQPQIAIRELEAIKSMELLPVMLKKTPGFMDTVRRLRRYVGNVKSWDLNESEVQMFAENALVIRELAECVFDKLKGLFEYKDDEKFHDKFQKECERFKEETANLTEAQKFTLCAEPYSRKTLLDQIFNEVSVDSGINKMIAMPGNEI